MKQKRKSLNHSPP